MNLIDVINEYKPINEQEVVDKKAMLEFISNNPNYLLRDNLVAHFTTSAIIVNKELTKILFAYHLIYDSWSWVGGHNDGENNSLLVSLKEAKEETGLKEVFALNKNPIMLDNIVVHNHYKNSKYIPDHIHLNLTYLLVANDNLTVTPKLDENSGVRWFDIDNILNFVSEDRMKPIYQKAINYINNNKDKLLKIIKEMNKVEKK